MIDLEGVYFDAGSVATDIEFIESLTLTKSTKSGRPEPFRLLRPYKKLVVNLLGWKRPNGTRLYRRCYYSVARKNAKTQGAAGIGLDLLILDQEAEPEIYIAAKDRDQASICFNAAKNMVFADEELSDICKVTPYAKEIRNTLTGGVLKALSRDGAGKHGYNPSAVIFDEFHVWGASEQELYDALTSGSGARRQPLEIIITTAGLEEHSLCGKEYDYASKVQKGLFQDPEYFALIYEVPKDADWTDPAVWHLANPTMGEIVSEEYIRAAVNKALKVPSEQTKVRRLTMNQWVNSGDIWIPLDKWKACKWIPSDPSNQ